MLKKWLFSGKIWRNNKPRKCRGFFYLLDESDNKMIELNKSKGKKMSCNRTAEAVSHYILHQIEKDPYDTITQLKLHKMLYYMQGLFIAKFDKPLFKDKIMAWEYGPVVTSLRPAYKMFGKTAIATKGYSDFDEKSLKLSESELAWISEIYKVYSRYTPGRLVEMTHSETPWTKAVNSSDKTITYDSLKSYFLKKIIN